MLAVNFRSAVWWLLLVTGGVGNILFHERANDMARQLVRLMGLSPFLWTTRVVALMGAVAVLFFFRRGLNRTRIRNLAIFIPIALTLDLSLIIYPSERIHYLQYGLLTCIAYKAIGRALPAALMGFIIGYLDEAHQYWVLYANDPTVYFDWNDVVLNLMAALAALVVLLPTPQPDRSLPKQAILIALAAWILMIGALIFALNPDQYLFGNQNKSLFWTITGIDTRYHPLTAFEGAIILGMFLITTIGYYWPPRSVPDQQPSPSFAFENREG